MSQRSAEHNGPERTPESPFEQNNCPARLTAATSSMERPDQKNAVERWSFLSPSERIDSRTIIEEIRRRLGLKDCVAAR